jgi:hypothetical protein
MYWSEARRKEFVQAMGFGWVTKALFCTRCGLYDETRVCIEEVPECNMLTITALRCCRTVLQHASSGADSKVGQSSAIRVWMSDACCAILFHYRLPRFSAAFPALIIDFTAILSPSLRCASVYEDTHRHSKTWFFDVRLLGILHLMKSISNQQTPPESKT